MLGSSGSSRLLLPSIDPGAHSAGWLTANLSLSGFLTPVLASQSDEHAAEILHVATADGGRLPRITCSQPSGTSTLVHPFLTMTERLRTNKSVTLLSRVNKDRLEPKWPVGIQATEALQNQRLHIVTRAKKTFAKPLTELWKLK